MQKAPHNCTAQYVTTALTTQLATVCIVRRDYNYMVLINGRCSHFGDVGAIEVVVDDWCDARDHLGWPVKSKGDFLAEFAYDISPCKPL